jgi:acetoin utilization deacetylase AcuC-like enzyme
MKIYLDEVFRLHDTGDHPECARRLEVTRKHLAASSLSTLFHTSAPPGLASDEDLLLVHDQQHIDRVVEACRQGGGQLDPDTLVCPHSDHVARRAAGALVSLVSEAAQGGSDCCQSLLLCRPPGHHATAGRVMGFCLYNSVAVAARHLTVRQGLERVAILDFDAHHGNGTQDIFYTDPDVLYLSTHRAAPFYPGTGRADETGEGPGRGMTINLPVMGPPFTGVTETFLEETRRALTRFAPDMILVSAGFDGYTHDPVAGMGMEPEDFERIGAELRELAESLCQGRLVSVLEGGYSMEGLPRCIESYARGVTGASTPVSTTGGKATERSQHGR